MIEDGPQTVPEGEVAPPLGEGEPLAPGYRVARHLNRSRVLDVYEVWSEERACRCVAKVLRPDRDEDRKWRGRLLKEGRVLKRLTHLHIVRAYETLERPHPVVILETLAGDTLEYLIAVHHRRRLPLADVAFLGIHLCSAMHYLHRQGLLHLDLKPSNTSSPTSGWPRCSTSASPGRRGGGAGAGARASTWRPRAGPR